MMGNVLKLWRMCSYSPQPTGYGLVIQDPSLSFCPRLEGGLDFAGIAEDRVLSATNYDAWHHRFGVSPSGP